MRRKLLWTLALLLLMCSAFFLNCYVGLMFCPKCISTAAQFEIIDQATNGHIIDPTVVVTRPNGKVDTLSAADRKPKEDGGQYVGTPDSAVDIPGEPGKYSFLIQKEGYNNVFIRNVTVAHAGRRVCHMAKTERFILRLGKSGNSDTLNTITKRGYVEHCCP